MKKKPSLPKRKSRFQSVAYTLKACQAMGWMAGKTEFRQPYHHGSRSGFGMTKDLFGFIDVLAIVPGWPGVTGLQVTSDACISRRVKKILTECHEAALRFLRSFNVIEVWGYKRVQQGKRVLWDARRVGIALDDHQEFVISKLPNLSELRLVYSQKGRHEASE